MSLGNSQLLLSYTTRDVRIWDSSRQKKSSTVCRRKPFRCCRHTKTSAPASAPHPRPCDGICARQREVHRHTRGKHTSKYCHFGTYMCNELEYVHVNILRTRGGGAPPRQQALADHSFIRVAAGNEGPQRRRVVASLRPPPGPPLSQTTTAPPRAQRCICQTQLVLQPRAVACPARNNYCASD